MSAEVGLEEVGQGSWVLRGAGQAMGMGWQVNPSGRWEGRAREALVVRSAVAAGAAGLPFFALRAISDPADQTVPLGALSAIKENGRVDASGLSRYLMSHPGQVGAFIKMGIGATAAAKALKRGLRLLPAASFGGFETDKTA